MPILRGKEMERAFLCWRRESAYARRGKPHLIIAPKAIAGQRRSVPCTATVREEERE